MRIASQLPPPVIAPQVLGKAIKAGVSQSASVTSEDVLELSGLARIASSLGAEGIKALQALGEGGISQERLLGFVESLFQRGIQDGNAGSILAKMTNLSNLLGEGRENDLFSAIESRGISGNLKYLDSLDNLFNLGSRNVARIFDTGRNMSDEEFDVFLKSVADLLKAGVVGTRTVEWRGQPTQVFIENEVGSDYARARPYRRQFPV